MKIKKQFTLLVSFIIAIPIICISFIFLQKYLDSTKRYLISGYKEVEELEKERPEYKDALNIILDVIPHNVEYCLVETETFEIICTSIPELQDIKSMHNLWDILGLSSKDYFYQFTSPATNKNTILITRIPRIKPEPTTSETIISTLLVVFSICIVICIIFIFIISKTIFNSIMKIKNETRKIASGNLDEAIITKGSLKKQNEIMSILESLEKMRQSLWEAENRKNKFIMGISHDLRTPVAIIKGYTEAISDNVISSKQDIDDALQLIRTKTEQLENMINDLISFTKLNNYELKEQLSPCSITKLIKTFAKESELSANVFNRNILCHIDLPDDILIPMNRQLILRAFENIFSNALRYTNDGDKIEISASVKGDFILLDIADSGVGIKEEDLPHIFDLFYKSSKSRQGKSMGIGLSVVKSIFDTHGWKISVASQKDEGTCFSVQIPINPGKKDSQSI